MDEIFTSKAHSTRTEMVLNLNQNLNTISFINLFYKHIHMKFTYFSDIVLNQRKTFNFI